MPTIDSSTRVQNAYELCYQEKWSALDAGAAVDLSWTSADGPALVPYKVELEVITPPTDRSLVQLQRTTASDNGSARTIRVAVDTTPTGSLTGAVVAIRLYWIDQASGGIS